MQVGFLLVSSVFGGEETSGDLSDQVTPKEGRIYKSNSSLGPIKFWLLFPVIHIIYRHKIELNSTMYPRFGVVRCHLDDGHTQIASNAERNEETCRDEQTIDFFFSLEAS